MTILTLCTAIAVAALYVLAATATQNTIAVYRLRRWRRKGW